MVSPVIKVEAPLSAPTGKCSEEKKRRLLLLFSSEHLIPRGLELELDVPLFPQEIENPSTSSTLF
ncbi:hypothetical protein BSG1_17231 [Bacillus sp. SG-1]|nr:hypothetical protein BSG1_17231 [Bacillus sp. SG-1]